MVKVEYVRLFQEIAKEKGLELTHGNVDAILDTLEDSIVELFNRNESYTIGGFLKVERVHKDKREGKMNLEGKEGQVWTTPAKDVIKISTSKAFEKKHEVICE